MNFYDMSVADGIEYVGVNDHELDMFEGQFDVPQGMAYNSYLVRGEAKTAVMDAVDGRFADVWLANIKATGVEPDYLVVQHMEPDHSSGITKFAEAYPKAQIVSSLQAFKMMEQFFGTDFADRRVVVAGGGSLDLGAGRVLSFIAAPMVHWPEVLMTYDAKSGTLFSADGFGKFGANDVEDEEGWDCEARRYYFGIVGKYGMQVQAVLKKAATLDIKTVCPLHGPVLKGDELANAISKYGIWSSYGVETEGVFIAYTSVYGHTKEAAALLKEELLKAGCPKVAMADLAREDFHESIEDAFRYGKLVLATTTYNMGVFPKMEEFVLALTERLYQKRTVALIENGSWAPQAAKLVKAMFGKSKDISFVEPAVTVRGALSQESRAAIAALAKSLA